MLLLCPTIHTLHLVRAQQNASAYVFTAIIDWIKAIQLENTSGGHDGRLEESLAFTWQLTSSNRAEETGAEQGTKQETTKLKTNRTLAQPDAH